jgi:cell division protein FtsB
LELLQRHRAALEVSARLEAELGRLEEKLSESDAEKGRLVRRLTELEAAALAVQALGANCSGGSHASVVSAARSANEMVVLEEIEKLREENAALKRRNQDLTEQIQMLSEEPPVGCFPFAGRSKKKAAKA